MSALPNSFIPVKNGAPQPLVLIVEDHPNERVLLETCMLEGGLNVMHAKNGHEAVQACAQQVPDIILMDVHMPKMGGIEAMRAIRERLGDDYVPVIFLTELDSSRQLLACMEAGGNDFLLKPFNPIILSAKVRALLRMRALYQTQQEQYEKLKAHQVSTDIEQEFASSLNKKIVESGFVDSPNVNFDLSPMAMFNGDILLCAYTPANKLHLLLGDFTGHGISASVAAAPASEIFYGMTSKGFGIVEIAEEINKKLVRLLPANMFLAATILCLDQVYSNLSLITCGLPDHFLYSRSRETTETIHSTSLPLGIVPQNDLGAKVLRYKIDSDDRLILFSDGVIEAENGAGDAFGFEGVRSVLNPNQSGINSILSALSAHQQDQPQQDDITLVEVICDLAPEKWLRQENQNEFKTLPSTQWKQSYTFYADTLKRFNPVPMAVHALMEIQGLQPFRESIFLVVNELFVNALEHGLLELDSALKKSPEGFAEYFDQRTQRLETLDEGMIELEFEHTPVPDGGKLTVSIYDTGSGFLAVAPSLKPEKDLDSYHGRGLSLIREVCESLNHFEHGRKAQAVFKWSGSNN